MTRTATSGRRRQRNPERLELEIVIQLATAADAVPAGDSLRRWAVRACLDGGVAASEMTLRIVGDTEMRALNERYRGARKPTNVLAFDFEDPPGVHTGILGDVVICAPVVTREAQRLGIDPDAHWAHMVVHGVLHLCGLDHEQEEAARRMEDLEGEILQRLGFANPYER